MADDSSAANDNAEEGVNQEYQNPNDLSVELSPEDELALVNETLSISGGSDDAGAGDSNDESNSDDNAAGVDKNLDGGEAAKSKDEPAEAAKGTEAAKQEDGEKQGGADDEEPKAAVKDSEADKPAVELTPVQTDDLWVEVDKVVTDDEGKETVEKIKLVFDPENPGSFLPDDFKFASDKQLYEILEAKAEMTALYKERKAEYDKGLEEKTTEETAAKTQEEQLKAWDVEIQSLIDAGVMPEPKAKPGDKDFMEDETVKKTDAVFKFMKATNEQNLKDGKAPIRSFGTALTMYENDAKRKADEEAKQKENEDAKRKGALVGGSSAASSGNEKVYRSGSYANIHEVPVE